MMKRDARYIFVTGGVVSSLGKGIVAASLGKVSAMWLRMVMRLTLTLGITSAS